MQSTRPAFTVVQLSAALVIVLVSIVSLPQPARAVARAITRTDETPQKCWALGVDQDGSKMCTFHYQTPTICTHSFMANYLSKQECCRAHFNQDDCNSDVHSYPVYACRCAAPTGPPVCGQDGKVYDSPCMAGCTGVTVKSLDARDCQRHPWCFCSKHAAPVCGSDGKIYSNACMARCKGVKVVAQRLCRKPAPSCMCPEIYDPCCGEDGKTYSNTCAAGCAKVRPARPGACMDEMQLIP